MRIIKVLFLCHLAALLFGLGGLLIALPHPELWNNSSLGVEVFNFGMTYSGSLHIIFGAATMFCFGWRFIGLKRTLIFFFASAGISLSMELMGTSTGFPFGAYEYTAFLGFKVADLVPYSIPLSWFYMGFTSYLTANIITDRLRLRNTMLWSIVLGTYFLTVWDLSLDPAMASPKLPIRFWNWYEAGPYFGMPIRNLVGWSVTGLIYMSVSRLCWRSDLDTRTMPAWLLFGMYSANTVFAIALALSAGLWIPAIIAVLFGLLPASLILFLRPQNPDSATREVFPEKDTIAKRMSFLSMRAIGRLISKRNITVKVEGVEHVPVNGPVLVVARHVHHLYDGCILMDTLPRQPHILVALDWIKTQRQRKLMEWACALVDWPIILRKERLVEQQNVASVYLRTEAKTYLRRAVKQIVQLLRSGALVVVFPEAYPNVDPEATPKQDLEAYLPFRPGFSKLVELVERDGQTEVAVIPTGLQYTHTEKKSWNATIRFGSALFRKDFASAKQLLQAVEQQVHQLSSNNIATLSRNAEEAFQL